MPKVMESNYGDGDGIESICCVRTRHISGMVAILLISGGLTMIVYCGDFYVKDYMETQTYRRSVCTIRSVAYTNQVQCDCDASGLCISFYPCLEIKVSYDYRFPNGSFKYIRGAFMYDNYKTLQKKIPKCAVYNCEQWDHTNKLYVEEYGDKYGHEGVKFECAYNPDDELMVLQESATREAMVLSISISGTGVGIGIIMIIGALCCPPTGYANDDDDPLEIQTMS